MNVREFELHDEIKADLQHVADQHREQTGGSLFLCLTADDLSTAILVLHAARDMLKRHDSIYDADDQFIDSLIAMMCVRLDDTAESEEAARAAASN